MPFLFAPPPMPVIPVEGERYEFFPVHRVYCVARNFRAHAEENGAAAPESPFFFMKAADMIRPVAEKETIKIAVPPETEAFEHEVELVAALSKGGRNLTREEAEEAVWGWCAGIDFTRRDLVREAAAKGRPWTFGKNFEGAAPVTHVRPKTRVPYPEPVDLWLYVNNQKRQSGNTDEMIFDPFDLIAELSRYVTLASGDLVFTGTPGGAGNVRAGDRIRAGVNGVGSLNVEIV